MRAGSGGRGEAAAVQAACREVPTVAAEGKASAKRTANIHPMFETLDVSKLSGWLNAGAPCQVKEGSIGRRGDMRAGGREGVGRRQRCKQRAGRHRLWGVRVGRCGAHQKHGPHVGDAGRVPARDVGVEIAHA